MARSKRISNSERIDHLMEEYGRIGDSAVAYRTEEKRREMNAKLEAILAEVKRLRNEP